MKVFAAPLQGYTVAAWRNAQAAAFGGVDCYFSPFVRVEKGAPRRHDLRDIESPLCAGHHVIPQIIFNSTEEMRMLADCIIVAGYHEIDLNMGCPFPPQMNRGRGAAMVGNTEVLREVAAAMTDYPDVTFSVKMRLGRERADEWRQSVDIINAMPLSHVTVHPRVGRQQYKGELQLDDFSDLLSAINHPVIFNGDIQSITDAKRIRDAYPTLTGIMIGRGLLARPSLANELRTGIAATDQELLAGIMQMHSIILEHFQQTLCGDAQILSKIKTYWDYITDPIPRKLLKQLSKAPTLPKYLATITDISR